VADAEAARQARERSRAAWAETGRAWAALPPEERNPPRQTWRDVKRAVTNAAQRLNASRIPRGHAS
jgi:hypothetical protein